MPRPHPDDDFTDDHSIPFLAPGCAGGRADAEQKPARLRADFALALEDFDLERANIDDLLQRAQNHKVLKTWLRQEEKIAQQQFIEDDLQAAMQEAMESLMREFRPPAPKPKRRKRA